VDPWVHLVLLHDGQKLHARCNNNKYPDKTEGCKLNVGQTVKCQFFPDRLSFDAGGYDLICGNDRTNGKLVTSAKNELLQSEEEGAGYLVTRSEPFIHHYEGDVPPNPCGLDGNYKPVDRCDKEEIRYTLNHKGVRIVATCQSWVSDDGCGELRVGKEYVCDGGTTLMSCADNATLSVEFAEKH